MSGNTMIILSAFVVYLLLMIVIGVVYMKKTNNSEDYFLGGRGLNAWVAALSAQASDMSGWLLMGLPGAIYSLGTGQIWIAVGLFIGTVLNWICISGRLRKYTIVANNSMTIPAFFENRYRDKKKILLLISSIVIVIFFLVYTASALAAGGKLGSGDHRPPGGAVRYQFGRRTGAVFDGGGEQPSGGPAHLYGEGRRDGGDEE